MGAKFVPTDEQLTTIRELWYKTGNYATIAKQIGVSVPVIKRLIEENIEKEDQDTPFERLNYYDFYRRLQQLGW